MEIRSVVLFFFNNPVDQTNQPTKKQMDTGENTTSLAEVTMTLFYSSVPVSHDSVTVRQHAQYRTLRLKQLIDIQTKCAFPAASVFCGKKGQLVALTVCLFWASDLNVFGSNSDPTSLCSQNTFFYSDKKIQLSDRLLGFDPQGHHTNGNEYM